MQCIHCGGAYRSVRKNYVGSCSSCHAAAAGWSSAAVRPPAAQQCEAWMSDDTSVQSLPILLCIEAQKGMTEIAADASSPPPSLLYSFEAPRSRGYLVRCAVHLSAVLGYLGSHVGVCGFWHIPGSQGHPHTAECSIWGGSHPRGADTTLHTR